MRFSLIVAAAGLLGLADAFASPFLHHHHDALAPRQFKAMTKKGCYSSKGSMVLKNNTNIFNTEGFCQTVCVPLNKAVLATSASIECWCGDKIPAESFKVDDSKCNTPCAGSSNIECGGIGFWTVYTSGIIAAVAVPQDASPSSSTAGGSEATATSVSPAVVTVGGATITATPSSTAEGSSKKSGPNVAAIAAGVVVGIVTMAVIAGGVFLFMRNKKRRQIEEEHRNAAAVNSFINGGKMSPHSAGSSFTDARLDPSVMGRRISVGSIADNQDYSRKILRVTNA